MAKGKIKKFRMDADDYSERFERTYRQRQRTFERRQATAQRNLALETWKAEQA